MGYLPKDYVGVHTRVEQFHEKYPEGSIISTYELIGDDTVVFQATVTTPDRKFTGTSFGSVVKDKALEKLETVAVGRALAFAGFETQSGIASQEEMQNFQQKQDSQPEEEKEWFNDDDFDKWVDSDKPNKPKSAKEMRQHFRVSKEMAKKIDEYVAKKENDDLDSILGQGQK